MKTAICAIIKDEHLFLKEWIDWHLGLGFDAIHLFEDKGSKSHEEITKGYDNIFLRRYEDDKELQKVISPEYGNGRQVRLYQWFCEKMDTDYDWVAFIDVDEFVIFENDWNLNKLCKAFEDVPAVYLFWKMKGASRHIKRPTCGVMEAYTEDTPFVSTDARGWNSKSLVNLKKGKGMRTCHHAIGGVRTDGIEGIEPVYTKAWLNHYFSKSWEDWCDRIYKRGDVHRGHRTLAQFFEANPSMEHLRDELIASVSDRIPSGTYWLDKKRGLIAGGNVKKITMLNRKYQNGKFI